MLLNHFVLRNSNGGERSCWWHGVGFGSGLEHSPRLSSGNSSYSDSESDRVKLVVF